MACFNLHGFLKREGRCGGGIACQDTAQVRPCSLFLDVLSRKVLVVNTPTPASALPEECIYLKPVTLESRT